MAAGSYIFGFVFSVEDTDVGVGFVAGGAYMPWSMRCADRPGAVQHLVLRVLGRMCEARDRTVRHGQVAVHWCEYDKGILVPSCPPLQVYLGGTGCRR